MQAANLIQRRLRVCGDCAERMLAAGCELDREPVEIAYGATCEVHRTAVNRAATNVLEVPLDWVDIPLELVSAASPCELLPLEVERNGGLRRAPSVTELAIGLIAAWSASDKGANADQGLIDHAVGVAHLLLSRTKGE